MPNIYVDFDVFKAITARRPTEDVSENDVLRQLFGLPPLGDTRASAGRHKPGDWVVKGVRLPNGTELRGSYKGRMHAAQVKDGALVLDGKRYGSPSAAAMSITNSPVNGWRFWEVKLPGQGDWRPLGSLRIDT